MGLGKALTTIVLLLGIAIGCGRKADDELPARVGDLEVIFKIVDEFGRLPDTLNIPVILSIATDTLFTSTSTAREQVVTAKNHEQKVVGFKDMAPSFFYVKVLINRPGLPPTCSPTAVFVRENMVTRTDLISLTLLENLIRCD